MDRIINVKVSGNHLTKDSKNAGTRGEANITKLRITFDDGWRGYAKSVTFWDAHGLNPTRRTLTTDLLENGIESTKIYLVPIPPEAMGLAGELTFTIEGYSSAEMTPRTRQIGVSATLEVKDALITDVITEPTPDQFTQMQGQYESILADIIATAESKIETEAFAESAKNSMIGAEHIKGEVATLKQETIEEVARLERSAKTSADRAGDRVNLASREAQKAQESAKKAENALGKTNYIGENGNWFAWDSVNNAFYDTGVRAQSGSEVYVGDNPHGSVDVWIDPNGDGVGASAMIANDTLIVKSPLWAATILDEELIIKM